MARRLDILATFSIIPFVLAVILVIVDVIGNIFRLII